ncbi:MAG: hypothetical protein O7B32_01495 [Thaumarchaeota archaeon]|nr:hypothetical protein [Nitrososphaerota archaeon]
MSIPKSRLLASLLLQLTIGILLAHGFDYQVSIVAGKNILTGSSPYEGGTIPDDFLDSYGSEIGGPSESTLWVLYLGLAYYLSFGNVLVFNIITKLPIIGANLIFAHYALKFWGRRWSDFFLFNPFLLLISTAWGKPDNIAALFLMLSILAIRRPSLTGIFLSLSFMIKFLAPPVLFVTLVYYLTTGVKNAFTYLGIFLLVSSAIFFVPFIVLGWSLSPLLSGLTGFLQPAGGISPFNIFELLFGVSYLPTWAEPLGFIPLIGLGAFFVYVISKPPRDRDTLTRYSLIAMTIIFATRSWTSEQNLIILFPLMLLAFGRIPNPYLWILPLVFMIFNTSLFQLVYPIYPQIIEMLAIFDESWRVPRLAAKFLITLPWLYCLYYSLKSKP